MFAFILGTMFGILIGMVLNHAVEESERRRAEAERLREVINSLQGGKRGN